MSHCADYSLTYGIAVLEFAALPPPPGAPRADAAPAADSADDWVEVQLSPSSVVTHRVSTIDIDQSSKSDRPEWGHLRYLSHFDPRAAFELSLQWTVATGALVADLIASWMRKAQQQHQLSLIPVPGDPFALPITPNTDPIRGPIFVALDASPLIDSRDADVSMNVDEETLFAFRGAIARKFGFVACSMAKSSMAVAGAAFTTEHQGRKKGPTEKGFAGRISCSKCMAAMFRWTRSK